MKALVLCGLVFSLAASASGELKHLKSKVLKEDRTYRVSVPQGYESSGERYPVLLMLDGQSHFAHVSASANYLMEQDEIPKLIVVGLDSTNRVRDFTPTDWPEMWNGGGGAEAFRTFLSKELLPEIEKAYRTDGFRVLAGHSASAQFALYCLESEPALFQGYLALSPSLDWDHQLPARGLAKSFEKKTPTPAFAFVARSDDRGKALEDFNQLVDVFKKKAPPGLRFTSKEYDHETHGSIPLVGMIDALRALYAGWRVPEEAFAKGLPAIETHFAGLSKMLGRPVAIPEGVVNALGYEALGQKQGAKAVELFQRNVAAHPSSANALDSLADGLAEDGQLEAAVVAREKSVKLAKQNGDVNLATFEKRLKTARDELKKKK